MKLKTQSNRLRRSQAGFTLIEISLVIALILGLITVAFMGVGAYRKGANEAKCKMQLAQVQKAVRSYANMQNMESPNPLAGTLVFGDPLDGAGGIMPEPACPEVDGDYTWADIVPAVGTPYGTCSYAVAPNSHDLAGETTDW